MQCVSMIIDAVQPRKNAATEEAKCDPLEALAKESCHSDDEDECGAPVAPAPAEPEASAQQKRPTSPPPAVQQESPQSGPYFPCQEATSLSEGDSDSRYHGHPLGVQELERQRQDIDYGVQQETEDWIMVHRNEQSAYFGRAAYQRNFILVNEAQRLDRRHMRRTVAREYRHAPAHVAAAVVKRETEAWQDKWNGMATHVGSAQQVAGPEAVMRGLSTMRIFIAGQQSQSFTPDEKEMARRQRVADVLNQLKRSGSLFLPAGRKGPAE
eukprot:TRINITY_DN10638_c0_g1_i2.p2 TRINITY_DN10638_c0_g1~~TRINITY_DN10638_c0_g1_i2.p2  ORF type:complete len:268 (+),score=91.88 TRINITY_DN10638_c0_g1_i2:97-900(+)